MIHAWGGWEWREAIKNESLYICALALTLWTQVGGRREHRLELALRLYSRRTECAACSRPNWQSCKPHALRIIGLINCSGLGLCMNFCTCCRSLARKCRQRFLTASMNNCPTCGGAVEIWHFDCAALHHNLPIYSAHVSCCRFFRAKCSLSACSLSLTAWRLQRHNLFRPVDVRRCAW